MFLPFVLFVFLTVIFLFPGGSNVAAMRVIAPGSGYYGGLPVMVGTPYGSSYGGSVVSPSVVGVQPYSSGYYPTYYNGITSPNNEYVLLRNDADQFGHRRRQNLHPSTNRHRPNQKLISFNPNPVIKRNGGRRRPRSTSYDNEYEDSESSEEYTDEEEEYEDYEKPHKRSKRTKPLNGQNQGMQNKLGSQKQPQYKKSTNQGQLFTPQNENYHRIPDYEDNLRTPSLKQSSKKPLQGGLNDFNVNGRKNSKRYDTNDSDYEDYGTNPPKKGFKQPQGDFTDYSQPNILGKQNGFQLKPQNY